MDRYLPLATLLQPHALVGLAWCNRNAVPMHNQTVIDRNDDRLYDFIQPMPCSRGFQSYVPDILAPVTSYCFGAIVAYFWRQIYSELASYLSTLANCRQIELQMSPVRYASQEGLGRFTGGGGGPHWGEGNASQLEFWRSAEARNGVAGRTG